MFDGALVFNRGVWFNTAKVIDSKSQLELRENSNLRFVHDDDFAQLDSLLYSTCCCSVGYMFRNAAAFDQDSNNYFDVSKVKYLEYAYKGAAAFSHSLCSWGPKFKPNIEHPRDYEDMFGGTS